MSVTGKNSRLFRRFATKQTAAAAALGGLDQSRDLIELHAVLDRTENAVLVQAVAHRNGLGEGGQLAAHLVKDARHAHKAA